MEISRKKLCLLLPKEHWRFLALWIKFSADDILKYFFIFLFFQKTDFNISCKLSPLLCFLIFFKDISCLHSFKLTCTASAGLTLLVNIQRSVKNILCYIWRFVWTFSVIRFMGRRKVTRFFLTHIIFSWFSLKRSFSILISICQMDYLIFKSTADIKMFWALKGSKTVLKQKWYRCGCIDNISLEACKCTNRATLSVFSNFQLSIFNWACRTWHGLNLSIPFGLNI